MFPTPVGMNRVTIVYITGILSVPHTRGDEPSAKAIEDYLEACSPHPWG